MKTNPEITEGISESFRKHKKAYIVGIILFSSFIIVGSFTGFFGIANSIENDDDSANSTLPEGYMQLNLTKYGTDLDLKTATWEVWGIECSDKTEAERELVKQSEMTLLSTKKSGDKVLIDEDYEYWINASNGPDFQPQWLAMIEGSWNIPLMNKTQNVGVLAYDSVNYNSSIVNTKATYMTVLAQCYTDAGAIDTENGFLPWYNASSDTHENLVFTFTFDSPMELYPEAIKTDENYFDTDVVGSSIVFEFKQLLFKEPFEFNCEFNPLQLNSLYKLNSISVGKGNIASSETWTTKV